MAEDVLNVTIEGPLSRVFRERSQDPESFDATLRYRAPDGSESTFEIELRTRGFYRLKTATCSFPPLRVNFKKSAVEGTIFAGQDKLKLVTHCQDNRDEYQQYVLQEYLIYRAYNLLTDLSFRARLAQITYVDNEGRRDPITKYAFFLEDDEAMATRNGWDLLEVPQVVPTQMQQPDLALVEVFQFMIGNTDWDAFRPEPDDPCCHNTKLVGSLQTLTVIPVPYDFDWSGLIDARYATPNPELRLRSVRDRLFRGICRPREELDAALAVFADRREAVYETFRSLPGLDPRRLEDTLEYLDEFYEILGDPNKVEREIVRRCRQA
ncbi:MAG: hypothetical protein IH616_02105 [Gemmatimonadales bacterium]|nr:hypothetical protein [Gemmatimonadales bacterium]